MKVKELPDNTPLHAIPMRLPDKYKDDANQIGLETQKVYFHSSWFCGVWFKTDPEDERVYPMQIHPQNVLEWDVWEERKPRKKK